MINKENFPFYVSPEGLTGNQEILAEMLFNTEMIAPVPRRIVENGVFKIVKVDRLTKPIDFAQLDGEFAFKHHEQKPDAPLSPVMVNLRNLPENVLFQAGKVLSEVELAERPDFCTGIPLAGSELARYLSLHKGIPYRKIFDKIELEDQRRIVGIENPPQKGAKVLIVDDTATEGKTKVEASEAAKIMGYSVRMLILVDRQQGAIEKLRKEGLDIRAAMTIDQILRYGLRVGRIDKELFYKARNYLLTNKI